MTSIIPVQEFQPPFISTAYGYKVNKPNMENFFQRTRLPWVGEKDLGPYVTDMDLRKLENAMISDTLPHRMAGFWKDNSAQSFAYLTISVLVGEGINITIDDKDDASDIINDWNDEINVKHESIEDLIATTWLDNLINRHSLWRTFVDDKGDDEEHLVDLQRISMRSIKIEEHPTRGWRRFIQRAMVPRRQFDKNHFYRKDPLQLHELESAITVIPDEPNCCLYFNFFKSPPVSSVLHLMVYKRWITWFMRKYAEKYWAPFLIGYVGDPNSGYMPPDKPQQEDSLQYTVQALKKIRNFGVASFLGHTKVEVLDTKSAKSADVYVSYLEYLNKEIVLGLLGSMALREGSRQEATGNPVVQQGYLRFIRGIRNKFSIKLRKFYATVLLPAYGKEGIKPKEIKIEWPPLKLDSIKDVLGAIEIGAKTGAFKDAKEIRKILTPIWAHIDANITDSEAKEMKNTFMEINSPSRAMGDQPQQRATASKKKPAK